MVVALSSFEACFGMVCLEDELGLRCDCDCQECAITRDPVQSTPRADKAELTTMVPNEVAAGIV